MTLEAIKREISLRLREIRDESDEFSDALAYHELQQLITKTISRVALCESAADLEAIDDLLAVIEDCWNSCKSETTGQESDEGLFEFNFELDVTDEPVKKPRNSRVEDIPIPDDDEEDEKPKKASKKSKAKVEDDEEDDDEEEDSEEYDEEDEEYEEDDEDEECEDDEENDREESAPALDFSRELEEFDKSFEKIYPECNNSEKNKLKALREEAFDSVNNAPDKETLTATVYSYRRRFKKFAASVRKRKLYHSAKQAYDEKHPAESMTKPNVARIVIGCATLLSGITYGIIDAIMFSRPGWPWNEWAWAMIGFGLSYLLVAGIYALAISVSVTPRIARRLSFYRVIIAVLSVIGALILGLSVKTFGVLCAFVATLPLTLFGAVNYLFYRLRLAAIAQKIAKRSVKAQKKEQAKAQKTQYKKADQGKKASKK